MSKKIKIIILVGPTASGKSNLAINIARRCGGEIISADSRQVYKGLEIGSGQVTKKDIRGVKHYGLGIVSLQKKFTSDDFRKYADTKILEIHKRGRIPILVGGTGFYIDAVLYGSAVPVPPDQKLRGQLEKISSENLFKMLRKLDSLRAKDIDKNNPRRLMRAIEIAKTLGKVPALKKVPRYTAKIIFLNPPRKELKKRIARRTAKMLKRGLLAEVKKLHDKLSRARLQELGFEYKYPLLFLEGKIPKSEMIERINTKTWHYAKRQMTWFKKFNKNKKHQ